MSYRRVRKQSDELLHVVWSLVMVRNQLPAQVVNSLTVSIFFLTAQAADFIAISDVYNCNRF